MIALHILQNGTPEKPFLTLISCKDSSSNDEFTIQRNTGGLYNLFRDLEKWENLSQSDIVEMLSTRNFEITSYQSLSPFLEALDPNSSVVAVGVSLPISATFNGGPFDGLCIDGQTKDAHGKSMIEMLGMRCHPGAVIQSISPKQQNDLFDQNGTMGHFPTSLSLPAPKYKVINMNEVDGEIQITLNLVN